MNRNLFSPAQGDPKRRLFVWWVQWVAFLVGIFVFCAFLSRPAGDRPATDPSLWPITLIPLAVSVILRWVFLPRARVLQTAYAQFVIGIAMAEAVCFFGIFLFPDRLQILFPLSVVGVFQFIPLFARRLIDESAEGSRGV